MTNRLPLRRALISVSDKTGLVELAGWLSKAGVEMVSTGSTAQAIRDAGLPVTDVSSVTGFAEALDGRVKTLHPAIHGGILADRRLASHREQLEKLGIAPFDLVVVNLYPFEATVASGAPADDIIENIDIGGPALIRAAAKNHASAAVVVDPAIYSEIPQWLGAEGLEFERRRELAGMAYQHTARYDQMIARWFGAEQAGGGLPEAVSLLGENPAGLRYGENSHQDAALYSLAGEPAGLAQAEVIQGKEMSYNNFLDSEAALQAVLGFDRPTVAIIKHQNPCGVASAGSLLEAYRLAHESDPVSAFGGVIAMNRPLDAETARAMTEVFTEVIVTPALGEDASEVLQAKSNLRVVVLPEDYSPGQWHYRAISGGLLVQRPDRDYAPFSEWEQVAGDPVGDSLRQALEFAWRAVGSVKSNAILLAQGSATVGIGMGQVSRVDSCELAVRRAGDRAKGAVAASDAFFPFPDGLQILIDAGVSAVVQPGGSVRDAEVIEAAQAGGVALFHTGQRHFFH